MSAGQLIWLRGLKGPEAQILHGDAAPNEFTRSRLLRSYPLDASEIIKPLDVLAATYPPPAIPDDTKEETQ